MATRLDSVDQQLSARLQEASVERQRTAAASAALLAVSSAGMTGDIVEDGRAALANGLTGPQHQSRLHELVAELDERAFGLQEDHPDEYIAVFCRARAAAALACALDSDPRIAALEGVYEAQAAVDEPERIIEAARSALAD